MKCPHRKRKKHYFILWSDVNVLHVPWALCMAERKGTQSDVSVCLDFSTRQIHFCARVFKILVFSPINSHYFSDPYPKYPNKIIFSLSTFQKPVLPHQPLIFSFIEFSHSLRLFSLSFATHFHSHFSFHLKTLDPISFSFNQSFNHGNTNWKSCKDVCPKKTPLLKWCIQVMRNQMNTPLE